MDIKKSISGVKQELSADEQMLASGFQGLKRFLIKNIKY